MASRRSLHSPYRWVGGISRAEMAESLRAAARGAAKNGRVEQALALRAHAERVRAIGPAVPPKKWPPPWERPRVSLERPAWRLRQIRSYRRGLREAARRERVAHTKALRLGSRPLLAMTCYGCGRFLPGEKFKRHLRNKRDRVEYVDRRCVDCKWSTRVRRSERTE